MHVSVQWVLILDTDLTLLFLNSTGVLLGISARVWLNHVEYI